MHPPLTTPVQTWLPVTGIQFIDMLQGLRPQGDQSVLGRLDWADLGPPVPGVGASGQWSGQTWGHRCLGWGPVVGGQGRPGATAAWGGGQWSVVRADLGPPVPGVGTSGWWSGQTWGHLCLGWGPVISGQGRPGATAAWGRGQWSVVRADLG